MLSYSDEYDNEQYHAAYVSEAVSTKIYCKLTVPDAERNGWADPDK